ncbi:LysR family transcriptional regulator [Oerskovia enterophila]|uniref:Hydrogen peroxide-inducible protein activator n=1 Tax=Oerskovia enterophila TaxID=43678 RepID=A0ABX2YDS4_9CELL|nr:LysR family transcriptional regulator [Oerskovia enterophila]OCI33116.1 hydrogen peroxide-inducible protein activator [Oerskovia enterophila]
MGRSLDVLAACEAFVAVADRESFTAGALAAGISQSVASRRIGALEAHLGGRLFDRTSRRVALTALGRGVLPSAARLVGAAADLVDDARRSRSRPLSVGVPPSVPPLVLAELCAAGAAGRLPLAPVAGNPAERAEAFRSGRTSLFLENVPSDRARWTARLGVGSHPDDDATGTFHLGELRPARGRPTGALRRLWLQPEDDVPHVRDRMERARDEAGLAPVQVRVAESTVRALSEILVSDDLVLCTRPEASTYDLRWRPLGDQQLVRAYAVGAADESLAARFVALCSSAVVTVLGADDASGRATQTGLEPVRG